MASDTSGSLEADVLNYARQFEQALESGDLKNSTCRDAFQADYNELIKRDLPEKLKEPLAWCAHVLQLYIESDSKPHPQTPKYR